MHEFTDMTENWKAGREEHYQRPSASQENVAVAPVATRRPLRELQLQAGEISLETESLKRKSRWAADIEFRLTLFEQLEPDQWDALQDVTKADADEGQEKRLETPERQDVSVDVPVATWDLEEVDLPTSKFPHDSLPLQGGGEHFELHTTLEPDGTGPDVADGSDEWPTPPDSPVPGPTKSRKESPMEDPGHGPGDGPGDYGDHDDCGSPEVFSFAKSGAMEAIETPICSPIEVIEASVRSAESDHDHFDVDTIDTCLDTTFDSEAQSLLQMMCSKLKKGLKDSPERFTAREVKPRKPSQLDSLDVKLSKVAVKPVKQVPTVLSSAASPESDAMSTSTSSASRLRSRTLEPLPSWNFDTLRGYLNTFQRSKIRQQQRQQRLQRLTEVEICSTQWARRASRGHCPDRSPRAVLERQQPRQVTQGSQGSQVPQVPRPGDRERSANRAMRVTSTGSTASTRSASLSVPDLDSPGPMQVHCRGELWMEHRKKRQYLRREEARQKELKECTFKPQLLSTPRGRVLSSSLSCPKISEFTPRHERQCREHCHVELYDRQMQWRQRLEEKWDEARQQKQKEQLAEQMQQMQLAQLAPQPQLPQPPQPRMVRLRSPREVNEAFERFHQRSRQWQQACALRVLKAQKSIGESKMEKLQCGRQRSYTKDVTKAGRMASRDAKELKPSRARSEEPKCRDTSKAERHEVHRHLQTLRRALFDSKQWQGTSPGWQKALQVEVARSEGAGAAPIKIH